MAPPAPQSHDESGGGSTDLEDTGRLWPTFAALFLLTLLYSGFVTFIKHSGQEAGTLHLLTRTRGPGPCRLGTWLLTSPLCTLRPPAPFLTPGLLLQVK